MEGVTRYEINRDQMNIVNYLKKTSSGKIQRENHTIEFKTNKPARIEAQVTFRVFIRWQLKGKFQKYILSLVFRARDFLFGNFLNTFFKNQIK